MVRSALVWQHSIEGQIGLPVPGAEGHERCHDLELSDSPKPLLLEVPVEEPLLARLAGSQEAGGIERVEVGVGNEGGRLADGLPLPLEDHRAVFLTNDAPHGGPGKVAGGDAGVGVVPAILHRPEDGWRIVGRAGERSGEREGTCETRGGAEGHLRRRLARAEGRALRIDGCSG